MKIVVAYKWAPNPQDASVSNEGVVTWGNKRAISEYDPVAMRVARLLADATGAELIGITAGDVSAATPKATQAAAARGLDQLVVVADETLAAASADTYARVLAGLVRRIGDVDLIIAGDSSADVGGRSVPALLAAYLGIPAFADVSEISPLDDGLKVTRHFQGAHQVLKLNGAAVLSVTTDASSIPLIGMKDIMAARKKPVEKVDLAELEIEVSAGVAEVTGTEKPATRERKHIIFDSADAAKELVAALRSEGVL
ncbi:electron transfer flavoprotein subunit beta/FixA family protein [Arcanobacterium bovis]|uniref:Electron transfer flavoprotein small subunit n=1 Tax=Arcanobacterium bovis TaxID=2529275 RepID=A0A4Q9V2J7_9ACTO|nr:electron transfer flavoprotein beta subunit/FixA family protein [Arcanobacterium bovis]TBW23885.1 electron transfer flavoprotein beta subunit/FixA family protein [Arcanobacterium bovis]